MKTNEKLEALKGKVDGVRHELRELNAEDLEQVMGGVSGGDPFQQPNSARVPGPDPIARDSESPMNRPFVTFNSSGSIDQIVIIR